MQKLISKELNESDPQLEEDHIVEIMNEIKKGHNEINNLDENVVLVVGKTGSGKSTLVNYIGGIKLVGYDDYGVVKVQAQEPSIAIIGQSSMAETSIPKRCTKDDLIFWDCPGFEDNRGYKQDIINAFFLTRIVLFSKTIRICALIKIESTRGRSNDVIDFAEQIDRLFARNIEQYEKNIIIVVTQVPQEEKKENIQHRLISMLDNAKDSKGHPLSNAKALKNAINNKLCIFRAPKEYEVINKVDKENIITTIKDTEKMIINREIIQIAPSVSKDSVLAAISLYLRLNDYLKNDLEKLSKTVIMQYYDKLDKNEFLNEDLEKLKTMIENNLNKIPNVIRVDQLSLIIELNTKYFQEYANNLSGENMGHFVLKIEDKESSESIINIEKEEEKFENKKLVNRINSIKFLENIIADYAKFDPINLFELLKIPLTELKDSLELRLCGGCAGGVKNQEKSISSKNQKGKISKQPKKEIEELKKYQSERRKKEKEIADKEMKDAQIVYKQKKNEWETSTKVIKVVGGGAIGGVGAFGVCAFWGSRIGGAAATPLGPVGMAVGTGVGAVIGLIVGGIIGFSK